MANLEILVPAFAALGSEMVAFGEDRLEGSVGAAYEKAVDTAASENPWFTKDLIAKACANIGGTLEEKRIEKWLALYAGRPGQDRSPLTIGVVMAGNVPMVGFHDLACVLFSGHRFVGKLSADDRVLLPFLATRLLTLEPSLGGQLSFIDDKLRGFDAVIATGSNNTSRYFEYYFGKYPHIIRKNRNGVAVLGGGETDEELAGLGEDVFLYFGLGCRNVSKLFVPEGYDFGRLLEAFGAWNGLADHNKYRNNYDYYRSIYLINRVDHLDNGNILITRDPRFSSPPSVLHYEEYRSEGELLERVRAEEEHIQCIVSSQPWLKESIPFGTAQKPELWDYADGVDTMEFLLSLRQQVTVLGIGK